MVLMSNGSVRGCGNFRSPEGAWMFAPGTKKQYTMIEVADKSHCFTKMVSGNDHVLGLNNSGEVRLSIEGGENRNRRMKACNRNALIMPKISDMGGSFDFAFVAFMIQTPRLYSFDQDHLQNGFGWP